MAPRGYVAAAPQTHFAPHAACVLPAPPQATGFWQVADEAQVYDTK